MCGPSRIPRAARRAGDRASIARVADQREEVRVDAKPRLAGADRELGNDELDVLLELVAAVARPFLVAEVARRELDDARIDFGTLGRDWQLGQPLERLARGLPRRQRSEVPRDVGHG